jgi:ABC-type glycerol-3-phosphate transport system substrate-binding protein
MKGKMALMPLPAPSASASLGKKEEPATTSPGIEGSGEPRRTSTWGGTMLGISKRCQEPDLAWQFALHLYLDKKELAERFLDTNILPPLRDAWNQPAFREPNAYYSDQPLGDLYAQLAPQVPFQYTSPHIVTAKAKLGEALVACVQYYNQHGDQGFEEHVRSRLRMSAEQVRAMIRRNPY